MKSNRRINCEAFVKSALHITISYSVPMGLLRTLLAEFAVTFSFVPAVTN